MGVVGLSTSLEIIKNSNNPYEILGVYPNESLDAIKSKYKKLCKLYHPDIAGSEYTEIFIKIKDAWDYIENNRNTNRGTYYWVHSSLFNVKKRRD